MQHQQVFLMCHCIHYTSFTDDSFINIFVTEQKLYPVIVCEVTSVLSGKNSDNIYYPFMYKVIKSLENTYSQVNVIQRHQWSYRARDKWSGLDNTIWYSCLLHSWILEMHYFLKDYTLSVADRLYKDIITMKPTNMSQL